MAHTKGVRGCGEDGWEYTMRSYGVRVLDVEFEAGMGRNRARRVSASKLPMRSATHRTLCCVAWVAIA